MKQQTSLGQFMSSKLHPTKGEGVVQNDARMVKRSADVVLLIMYLSSFMHRGSIYGLAVGCFECQCDYERILCMGDTRERYLYSVSRALCVLSDFSAVDCGPFILLSFGLAICVRRTLMHNTFLFTYLIANLSWMAYSLESITIFKYSKLGERAQTKDVTQHTCIYAVKIWRD